MTIRICTGMQQVTKTYQDISEVKFTSDGTVVLFHKNYNEKPVILGNREFSSVTVGEDE